MGTVMVGNGQGTFGGGAACWKCGTTVDAFTSIERQGEQPRGPREGDASVCVYCGAVSVFDADLKLIQPDRETVFALLAIPAVRAAITAVIEARGMETPPNPFEDYPD